MCQLSALLSGAGDDDVAGTACGRRRRALGLDGDAGLFDDIRCDSEHGLVSPGSGAALRRVSYSGSSKVDFSAESALDAIRALALARRAKRGTRKGRGGTATLGLHSLTQAAGMPSDEPPVFDPDITALLTAAREPAWLDRLKMLEENRVRLLQDAAESDRDSDQSDPDAITVPADANLTWINNGASRDGGLEDRGSDTRMQLEDVAQREHSPDGNLDDEDEVMDDSILVEPIPNPVPPRTVGAERQSATGRRAIRALEMATPSTTSSSPVKRSDAIVELSSTGSDIDDPDSDGPRPVAQNAMSARPLPARTAKGAPTAAATKGKGRTKARLSLEQAVDSVLKLKGAKLTDPFPTVTDLVRHLAQYKSAQPNAKRSLDGCRIAFVNTDHWRPATTSSATVPRNPVDEGLRLCLTVAARQGATLVPPEDFVGAPNPALAHDQLDDPADRAEAEGWTTHIVPYVLSGQRQPTYDQILACLGPDENGLSREQLGPFAKVVKYEWIAACVGRSAKVQETMYLLGGDFREAARTATLPPLTEQQRRDVKARAQRVRDKVKQDERAREEKKKLRVRAGHGAGSDSQSGNGSSSGEDEIARVSLSRVPISRGSHALRSLTGRPNLRPPRFVQPVRTSRLAAGGETPSRLL